MMTNLQKMGKTAFIAALTLFSPAFLFAADVTLQWDAKTETNLAGYKLYWGDQSKQYTNSLDVGNVTTYRITGFPDTATLYFAVTAYFTNGVETAKSLEASIILPKRACDVNCNGTTDILDMQQIVNAILEGRYHANGDLDRDLKLNVLDLVREANVLLGKTPCPLP